MFSWQSCTISLFENSVFQALANASGHAVLISSAIHLVGGLFAFGTTANQPDSAADGCTYGRAAESEPYTGTHKRSKCTAAENLTLTAGVFRIIPRIGITGCSGLRLCGIGACPSDEQSGSTHKCAYCLALHVGLLLQEYRLPISSHFRDRTLAYAWIGCSLQEVFCRIPETDWMYPACLIGSRAAAFLGIRANT